jgi:hypothetical protein
VLVRLCACALCSGCPGALSSTVSPARPATAYLSSPAPQVLKRRECNVLGGLEPEQWHEARAIICDSIRHTDMATHPATVSMLAEKERFDPAAAADRKQVGRQLLLVHPPVAAYLSSPPVAAYLSSPPVAAAAADRTQVGRQLLLATRVLAGRLRPLHGALIRACTSGYRGEGGGLDICRVDAPVQLRCGRARVCGALMVMWWTLACPACPAAAAAALCRSPRAVVPWGGGRCSGAGYFMMRTEDEMNRNVRKSQSLSRCGVVRCGAARPLVTARPQVISAVLHAMDLSNVAYPWATAVPWARRVGQEFGEQVGASARARARHLLIGGGPLGHSISSPPPPPPY